MATPRQPVHPESDDFRRKMAPLYERLSRSIRKRITDEDSITRAVNLGVQEVGFSAVLSDRILKSVKNLAGDDFVKLNGGSIGMRRWWLDKLWPGDSLTLSNRINIISRMTDIKDALKVGFRYKRSWTGAARELSKVGAQVADIAKPALNLERAARRVLRGDMAAFAEYKKFLNQTVRNVKRLAKAGAPTQRLKKAYQNLIDKTAVASEEGLDKAMDRLIKAKARYNSERIARTEMAKAYGQGEYQNARTDPDAIGMEYDLSSRHPVKDICDFHTGANLYNLGPGIYPFSDLPPYPFHPFCLCVMSKAYRGQAKAIDEGKAKEFLSKQSKGDQKKLMGVKGSAQFRRDRSTWKKNLRNYQGHQSMDSLIQENE